MTDMRRLIDDPATPEGAREGLRETAAAAEPYDVDAGLRRLQAALAAGGVAAAGGTAAAATAGSTGLGKLGLAVALAGVLAGGGAIAYQAWSGPSDSHPSGPAPAQATPPPEQADPLEASGPVNGDAPSAVPAPRGEAPSAAAAEAPPAADDAPGAAEAAPASEPSPRAVARRRPAAVVAPAEASAPAEGLREETLHLARVRSALERSPAEALRLAREGQRRFPDGVFEEERRALIVMALDRVGHHERARRAAAAFIERYPNGPLTGRVREISEAR